MAGSSVETVSYSPIPLTVPVVLAPASRPCSPSTSSDFAKHATAIAGRLALADHPRRTTGVIHRAPPSAGATRLLVTALKGEVVGKPVWSKERDKDGEQERLAQEKEEEKAWAGLGILGLPKDEEEWAEWEGRKAEWRRNKAAQEDDSDVEIVMSSPAKKEEKAPPSGRKKKERRRSPSPAVEEEVELAVKAAQPARQPKLNSMFSSSKSSFAATSAKPSSSKKRPPTSPVPPPPARRSNSSNSLGTSGSRRASSSKKGVSDAGSGEEEETPVGRSNGRSLGEDEEILFESGCTQMHLPSPTPHRPPSQQQPSQPHLRPAAHHHSNLAPPCHSHSHSRNPSSPAAAPFSSPGLNNPNPLDRPPIAASTPFITRTYGKGKAKSNPNSNSTGRSRKNVEEPQQQNNFIPASRSTSPSRSPSPSSATNAKQQQTQFSTLATTTTNAAETLLKPPAKLHRLSSIARTESQRSSVNGNGGGGFGGFEAAGGGGGGGGTFDDAELSRFLDEDARD